MCVKNQQMHQLFILSTAPQLSIYHKALGTLPEDDSVMSKHVGAYLLHAAESFLRS
jgi:hypothetical protein